MNAQQFKQEVAPLRENLLHVARKMLENANDAEDLVQEVFLKLWYLRDTLYRYDSIPAFAVAMIKNLCIDRLRIRGREVTSDQDNDSGTAPDNPYLRLERLDTEQLLKKIIGSLPPLQKAIITMKDIDEYEVEEIAEITGTQPEAVRVNLSRARKKVREEYIRLSK
ncbi:MAG: sigma-70 family RNA polymerase sigma factor [Candidatus Azobacteroides sp.]|nr:sigma-70 family RNA polymerase sigma factor [Candidatus Azobacteroides sp.]